MDVLNWTIRETRGTTVEVDQTEGAESNRGPEWHAMMIDLPPAPVQETGAFVVAQTRKIDPIDLLTPLAIYCIRRKLSSFFILFK